MKRRVICVTLLLAYLLVVCTALSLKIEKEMLLQVEVRRLTNAAMAGEGAELPNNYLFWDEEGMHLYEVIEGTGWESGFRVQEIDPKYYSDLTKAETVFLWGMERCWVISTTSRQPSPGEQVEILDDKEERPVVTDHMLVLYPNGTPEGWKEEGTILARSDTAILLEDQRTEPFFERKKAGDYVLQMQPDWRIFSMQTEQEFWKQLPLVAGVGALVFCGLVMWLTAVICAGRTDRAGRVLWLPGAVSVLLLGGLVLLLHWINFPPSVLPPDNILDFSFYRERWQTIRQGLETLTGGPEELVSLAETVGKQCRLIAAGGALAAAALAVVQCRLVRKRS